MSDSFSFNRADGFVDFNLQLIPGDKVVLRDQKGNVLVTIESSVCSSVSINLLPSADGLV